MMRAYLAVVKVRTRKSLALARKRVNRHPGEE